MQPGNIAHTVRGQKAGFIHRLAGCAAAAASRHTYGAWDDAKKGDSSCRLSPNPQAGCPLLDRRVKLGFGKGCSRRWQILLQGSSRGVWPGLGQTSGSSPSDDTRLSSRQRQAGGATFKGEEQLQTSRRVVLNSPGLAVFP